MSWTSTVVSPRNLLLALLACSPLAARADGPVVTDVDRDANVIFRMTLGDAKVLQADGDTASDTITITGSDGAREYRFREHTLSCGTHMTGVIRETRRDGKTFLDGKFEVTRNPFKIERLLVKLVSVDATGVESGVLTVNGKEVDAARVR